MVQMPEPRGEAEPFTKIPKPEAGYREADTQGAACALCRHFQPPNTCAVVEGPVAPEDVSDLFEPQDAAETLNSPMPQGVM